MLLCIAEHNVFCCDAIFFCKNHYFEIFDAINLPLTKEIATTLMDKGHNIMIKKTIYEMTV